MGKSIYSFTSLLPPLVSVQERSTTIPAGQVLEIKGSSSPCLLIFMVGGIRMDMVGQASQMINRGDVLVMEQGTDRSYRPAEPGKAGTMHILHITFDASLLDACSGTGGAHAELRHLIREHLGGNQYIRDGFDKIGGRDILALIRGEAERCMGVPTLAVSGFALALISRVISLKTGTPAEPLPIIRRGQGAVEHASQFMREHYHESLSLSEIAYKVQLSGEHLERLFKKHLGCSVFTYLARVRLEYAKQQLLATDLPVVQIAQRCGFSSSTHLGRRLKEDTGLTPLEFRLSGHKNESFAPSPLRIEKPGHRV